MTRAAIGAAALAILLTGCGGPEGLTTTSVSIGQQLIDLKNARDSGAISEKEYEKAREKIIDNAR